MNKTLAYRLLFTSLLLLSVFLSLYSISRQNWVWESGLLYQKILGTTSGLAAFTGVVATTFFYKRFKAAYFYAITNAVLFGAYAISINLTGDFLVNIFWYIPIFITLLIMEYKNEKSRIRKMNYIVVIIFIILFTTSFAFFWFLTPKINAWWGTILKTDSVAYGANFNHYLFGRVLDTLSNSICIVALLSMVLGYKETWLLWLPKNIASLIFFSGVGVINISLIMMNVIFIGMASYFAFKVFKNKKMHIAIIGPGAVGKTTTISYLKDFFEENSIKKIDERTMVNDEKFKQYMNNLKKYAFTAQRDFYNMRFNQISEMQHYDRAIMDRHSIDDFIFSEVHINENNFNEEQKKKWKYYHLRQWWRLMSVRKLDLVFILVANNKTIEGRRSKRSAADDNRSTEVKNKVFFQKVNSLYHDDKSIMYKAAKKFAKEAIILENIDSKVTAKKIQDKINSFL